MTTPRTIEVVVPGQAEPLRLSRIEAQVLVERLLMQIHGKFYVPRDHERVKLADGRLSKTECNPGCVQCALEAEAKP